MARRKPSSGKLRLRSLADLDGRTTAARAALSLRNALTTDLGGSDGLSAMQQAILDNVAVLGAALEDMAAKYLGGEGANLSLYATLANSQRRLLADLGLSRKLKDITPTLQEYVKGRRA